MHQLKHFEDVVSLCLDKKNDLTRRDIIASLSYIGTCKGKNLKFHKFTSYFNYILDNVDALFSDKNIYLLVHRLAVLNYASGLSLLYKKYLSNLQFDNVDTKNISIICWALIKTDLSYTQFFESTSKILLSKVNQCNLTDLSLLLWSFCRFNPLQHMLILKLRNRLFQIVDAIHLRLTGLSTDKVVFSEGTFLSDFKSNTDEVSEVSVVDQYIDSAGNFYTNISHDTSMCAKSLSLVPGNAHQIEKLVDFTLFLSESGKVDLTAQCITSLWESLSHKGISNSKMIDRLCESSRYLRLDHTFNSNMLVNIMESNVKLHVKDARVIYQCIHWLDKRADHMHATHILRIAKALSAMNVDDEKAWKRLGVAIQSKGIELRESDLEELVEILKKIGRGNDRIYGILNHFISVKHDHATYGPT